VAGKTKEPGEGKEEEGKKAEKKGREMEDTNKGMFRTYIICITRSMSDFVESSSTSNVSRHNASIGAEVTVTNLVVEGATIAARELGTIRSNLHFGSTRRTRIGYRIKNLLDISG
jgi:hypothetical protein